MWGQPHPACWPSETRLEEERRIPVEMKPSSEYSRLGTETEN
jgi:hypothetical protein